MDRAQGSRDPILSKLQRRVRFYQKRYRVSAKHLKRNHVETQRLIRYVTSVKVTIKFRCVRQKNRVFSKYNHLKKSFFSPEEKDLIRQRTQNVNKWCEYVFKKRDSSTSNENNSLKSSNMTKINNIQVAEGIVTPDCQPPSLVMPVVTSSLQKLRTVAGHRQYLQNHSMNVKLAIINIEATIYRELEQRRVHPEKKFTISNQILQAVNSRIPFTREGWRAAAFLTTEYNNYYYQRIKVLGSKDSYKLPGSFGNNLELYTSSFPSPVPEKEKCSRNCIDSMYSHVLKPIQTNDSKAKTLFKDKNQYVGIKPCPLSKKPFQSQLEHSKNLEVARKKRVAMLKELKRLTNVTIIYAGNKADHEFSKSDKNVCGLGYVSKEDSRIRRFKNDSGSISPEDALMLRQKATARLAPVEKGFHSTIVLTDKETLVINESEYEKKRRCIRVPKRYSVTNVEGKHSRTSSSAKPNSSLDTSGNTQLSNPDASSAHKDALLQLLATQTPIFVDQQALLNLKHCRVNLNRLNNTDNIAPWCMVHHLYRCFCAGHAVDGEPIVLERDEVNVASKKANYSFEDDSSPRREHEESPYQEHYFEDKSISDFKYEEESIHYLECSREFDCDDNSTDNDYSATNYFNDTDAVYESERVNRHLAPDGNHTTTIHNKDVVNQVFYPNELDTQQIIISSDSDTNDGESLRIPLSNMTDFQKLNIKAKTDDALLTGSTLLKRNVQKSGLATESLPDSKRQKKDQNLNGSNDQSKSPKLLMQKANDYVDSSAGTSRAEVQAPAALPKIVSSYSLYGSDLSADAYGVEIFNRSNLNEQDHGEQFEELNQIYERLIKHVNNAVGKHIQELGEAMADDSKAIPEPKEGFLYIMKLAGFLEAFNEQNIYIWEVKMKSHKILVGTLLNSMPIVPGALGIININVADINSLVKLAQLILSSKANILHINFCILMQGRSSYWVLKGLIRHDPDLVCLQPTQQTHPVLSSKLFEIITLIVTERQQYQLQNNQLITSASKPLKITPIPTRYCGEETPELTNVQTTQKVEAKNDSVPQINANEPNNAGAFDDDDDDCVIIEIQTQNSTTTTSAEMSSSRQNVKRQNSTRSEFVSIRPRKIPNQSEIGERQSPLLLGTVESKSLVINSAVDYASTVQNIPASTLIQMDPFGGQQGGCTNYTIQPTSNKEIQILSVGTEGYPIGTSLATIAGIGSSSINVLRDNTLPLGSTIYIMNEQQHSGVSTGRLESRNLIASNQNPIKTTTVSTATSTVTSPATFTSCSYNAIKDNQRPLLKTSNPTVTTTLLPGSSMQNNVTLRNVRIGQRTTGSIFNATHQSSLLPSLVTPQAVISSTNIATYPIWTTSSTSCGPHTTNSCNVPQITSQSMRLPPLASAPVPFVCNESMFPVINSEAHNRQSLPSPLRSLTIKTVTPIVTPQTIAASTSLHNSYS